MKLGDALKIPTRELQKKLNCGELGNQWKGEESWLFEPKVKENKICIVAHIDTVHDEGFSKWSSFRKDDKKDLDIILPDKLLYYDAKKRVYWSPEGLGADDRAGVYMGLRLFNEIPEPYKPYLLLTDEEETGGDGAKEAMRIFGDNLKNVSYFIELDRKGNRDAVFYNSEPKPFVHYIESFGFKDAHGSFSDISHICPELEICGVNLSVGYYSQHTEKEYLKVDELEITLNKVARMLRANKGKQWYLPPAPVIAPYKYGHLNNQNRGNFYGGGHNGRNDALMYGGGGGDDDFKDWVESHESGLSADEDSDEVLVPNSLDDIVDDLLDEVIECPLCLNEQFLYEFLDSGEGTCEVCFKYIRDVVEMELIEKYKGDDVQQIEHTPEESDEEEEGEDVVDYGEDEIKADLAALESKDKEGEEQASENSIRKFMRGIGFIQ